MEVRPDGSVRHDGPWEDDRPIRNLPRTTKTAVAEAPLETEDSFDRAVQEATDEAIRLEGTGEASNLDQVDETNAMEAV